MEDAGPVDRLSNLCDDILCRILSFLPTPTSVSTSILAKRWRFLFAHVPDLYFDFHNWDYYRQDRRDIITRVVILHKSQTINTFCLSLFHVNKFVLETWIKVAMSRNLKNFDLTLANETLPPCLFTCKTLVTLSLGSVCIPSLDTVSLPSLKKLRLHSAYCLLDQTIPRLISGCLVLEELIIEEMSLVDQEELGCWSISSPTIKRLTVNLPYLDFSKVEIHAPALTYLKLDDCWYEHISLCPLTSLVEADICLNRDPYYPAFVFDFLHPLCNVKHLKLSRANTLMHLVENNTVSSAPILKFDSLTKLDLDASWRFLIRFLRCADNLQDLIIRKFYGGAPKKPKHAMIWSELFEQSPACMYSLRTVTFGKFRCRKQEFKMASYLTRNAKALKRVEIHFHVNSVSADTKANAIKRISSFEQGSKACKVVFH